MNSQSRTRRMQPTRAISLLLSLTLAACGTTQYVAAPPHRLPDLPAEATPQATPLPDWCRGECTLALSQRVLKRNQTLQTLQASSAASSAPARSASATTGPRNEQP